MKEMWLRIRRFESEGDHPGDVEIMYEARCDLFPDAAIFADTADEAYEQMTVLVPELMESYFETFGRLPYEWKLDELYGKEEDNG